MLQPSLSDVYFVQKTEDSVSRRATHIHLFPKHQSKSSSQELEPNNNKEESSVCSPKIILNCLKIDLSKLKLDLSPIYASSIWT